MIFSWYSLKWSHQPFHVRSSPASFHLSWEEQRFPLSKPINSGINYTIMANLRRFRQKLALHFRKHSICQASFSSRQSPILGIGHTPKHLIERIKSLLETIAIFLAANDALNLNSCCLITLAAWSLTGKLFRMISIERKIAVWFFFTPSAVRMFIFQP